MTSTASQLSLLAMAFSAAALLGQASAPKTPAGSAPAGQSNSIATPAQSQLPLEDELLVIKVTPYKPTLVRDPFSAPTDVANENRGDLIDDIGVKGRIISNGKVLAVVSDSRGNVRWLPVGYKFRDGELSEITEKAVVFRQRDVNSTSGVYRTVVKPFKREGGK